MATTQKAAPKKQSEGFQGVRGAFWIIVVCAIIAVLLFNFWMGREANFADATKETPINVWGTIFKGGVIVPVIHTLLLTVLALSIERWLALKTAFGKGALPKFVANIKEALNKNDFAKAQQLCNNQKGSVANVVSASLNAYKEMEATSGIKKAQKVAKIQQAHEEASQLEMPTLTMNLPMIATIVTLGTLTGLLGTVVGMIRSFSALSAGGGADSAALSAGISEALINTAFGIGTSWCAVVAYNYYTNKVDKLTFALDEVGYSIAQTYEANHAEEA
ncbi:MAG: MotA/TolQ/ExbB proton channel family protein [Prevotella sp.]|jgi:biopolymer transport protein ExbB|nr:MotA/TolQ/ExbB proton channel family protein [Prevotella sp.]MBP3745299.1 MotA/TolQ/ExbB proton channel family protein [Prevotella sp.]MBQ1854914.1 MotA/TolQ/ExbB proton channel family protein [Prevotella sp.]MBQ2338141.1 MotA/TolQ/ExbB proton channel family protein [Prevotella sp.]MBQ3741335.1 MotA/TolQ/ExbB proton channel family protein [Prevotella sp.]